MDIFAANPEPAELIALNTPQEPSSVSYVTYAGDGTLTGCYRQVMAPDHAACAIEVDDDTADAWYNFRANAARTGVEVLPPKPPPAPEIPHQVSRRQGLQALRIKGWTEAMIEAEISKDPDLMRRDLALIEFRASQVFERDRPLVVAMGAALSIDLVELFTLAASL